MIVASFDASNRKTSFTLSHSYGKDVTRHGLCVPLTCVSILPQLALCRQNVCGTGAKKQHLRVTMESSLGVVCAVTARYVEGGT